MQIIKNQKLRQRVKATKAAVKTVWYDKKSKLIILALTSLFLFLNAFILELLQAGRFFLTNPKTFVHGIYYQLNSLPLLSGISMIILSFLSALLIAMVIYAIRVKKEMTMTNEAKASAGAGVLLTLIAPACPTCGIGVLSALGFTTLGTILPFSGHEFSILGIIILVAAITFTAKQIETPTCKI